jgi:hypothetical protein
VRAFLSLLPPASRSHHPHGNTTASRRRRGRTARADVGLTAGHFVNIGHNSIMTIGLAPAGCKTLRSSSRESEAECSVYSEGKRSPRHLADCLRSNRSRGVRLGDSSLLRWRVTRFRSSERRKSRMLFVWRVSRRSSYCVC